MKKIIALTTLIIMLFSLAACNGDDESSKTEFTSEFIADMIADEIPEIDVTYGEFDFEADKKLYQKDSPGYNDSDFKNKDILKEVTKETAFSLAENEAKIVYERAAVDFDSKTNMWRVTFFCEEFYKDSGKEFTQKIYIDSQGLTVLSVTESN